MVDDPQMAFRAQVVRFGRSRHIYMYKLLSIDAMAHQSSTVFEVDLRLKAGF